MDGLPTLLLTGASGFVGGRLLERLRDPGRHGLGHLAGLPVLAFSRREPRSWPQPGVAWSPCDLTDPDAVQRAVFEGLAERRGPLWVLHLGGLADPRLAARHPRQARSANAEGTRNLLVALSNVVGADAPGRVLLVSTAAVYGQRALDAEGRIPAGTRPRTRTAYGWSKRLAERAALACPAPGLEVVVARPYNHAGPGQGAGYVVPDLCADLRAALAEARPMRTGNLWPERDLLHVDDVLDAYLVLLERGEAGTVYDVARGEARPVRDILDGLVDRLGAPVAIEPDPERVRAGESPRIVGDASRLRALGWEPTRDLDAILDDAVGAGSA